MNYTTMYIIPNIIMFCVILSQLYARASEGKLIIQTQIRKYPIIYIILLIGFSCLFIIDATGYLNNGPNDMKLTLQFTFWMQFAISNILRGRIYLGIRENGISIADKRITYFYKWDKIKSYKWISPDTIEFELIEQINSVPNKNMMIGTNKKQDIEEILKRYI